MASNGGQSRDRGSIERRGNSLRVKVYAGIDPLTGKRLYLTKSTTDENAAKRILNKFRAEVDAKRHARTRATLRVAIEEWLKFHDVEESTLRGYRDYLRLHIGPVIGDVPLTKMSARVLEKFYAEMRRCSSHCDGTPFIEHRVGEPHECRIIRHRRGPGRPPAAGYPPHDCTATGCIVLECQPHKCTPLSASTILKMHFVISGALEAAVRWEWISSNPAEVAKKPKQPAPQPKPPTPAQVAQIITAAWNEDEMWGTLVWLVMVTGVRRAELLALRWTDVDLDHARIDVRRNFVRADGQPIEKDTKTHRARLISLDPSTVELLTEHRLRYEATMRKLELEPAPNAFLFSYQAACDRPCDPSGITHRYERMCERLGIDSHLHAMRHYSATELLSSGVELPAVAGRLGHGGGGATTLRVYAAWVQASDRRAAEILGGRIERPRPASSELAEGSPEA